VKRKPIKPRKRLEGQIEALAKDNPQAAWELAKFGKVRSELEKGIWWYLTARKYYLLDKLPTKLVSAKEVALWFEKTRALLGWLFLDAVDSRDNAALLLIAKEVREFDRWKGKAEPMRAKILLLKRLIEEEGCERITRRQLAGSDDNLEVMGKIGKRLGFPFLPDKTGRPKGATNKLKR